MGLDHGRASSVLSAETAERAASVQRLSYVGMKATEIPLVFYETFGTVNLFRLCKSLHVIRVGDIVFIYHYSGRVNCMWDYSSIFVG